MANEVVVYTAANNNSEFDRVTGANPLPVVSTSAASSTNAAVDAFGRGRVTTLETLFESQPQYDKMPRLWLEKISGPASSTHLPDESSVQMDVTTAAGCSIIRQTREYFRYQPGKSQLIMCTFVMGTGQAETTKLVGYGDDSNGIFMGVDEAGVFVLLRTNITGTPSDARKVYQSSWNVDSMNGGGASGRTLDITKAQILVIDIEWLGVGRVRVGLNIDGDTFYVHEFLNANQSLASVYMTTANLPIRYEITNAGTAPAAASMKQICSQVASEGGTQETSPYSYASLPRLSVSVTDETPVPLLAIRQKDTFNGIENRMKVIVESASVLTSSGEAVFEVYYNPTITNGAWVDVDAESGVEQNITMTAFTGGTVVNRFFGTAGRSETRESQAPVRQRLPTGLDIDGTNGVVLLLAAYELTGNPVVSALANWREIR